VIEFEPAQVHPGDLHESQSNELVSSFGNVLMETNNLLVEFSAVASGFAPEDKEDRFAGAFRFNFRGRIIGEPAVFSRIRFRRAGIRDTWDCHERACHE
jgi:hypothetical protein